MNVQKNSSGENAVGREMRYQVLPERMPAIPPEQMSEAQRKVAADLVSTRGELKGPFVALIRRPELADRVQRLGAYIRYECGIDMRLNRLISMMVARHWSAQYEWHGAVPYAAKAGLSDAIVAAVAEGRRPEKMAEDEEAVYEFMRELLTNKSVSDPTYGRALARFGEGGVVDLMGIACYYTMQAMVMNVVRTAVPDGHAFPLAPLPQSLKPTV